MPDGSSRIREEKREDMAAGDVGAPATQSTQPTQAKAPWGPLLRRFGLARSEPQAMMMVTRDIGPYVRKASDRLHEWCERRSQRRALMALDDRMMRDIGIGRADAEQEYRKPFWR